MYTSINKNLQHILILDVSDNVIASNEPSSEILTSQIKKKTGMCQNR